MSKKIAICTSGSRGDTQPYIALALELISRGHEVYICTEERMKPLAEEFNVPYKKITGDPTSVLWEKESQVMLRDGKILPIMKRMEELTAPTWNQSALDYEEACKDMDIVVSGPLCLSQTYSIAEKYKIGFVPVLLGPSKSGDFPVPFFFHNSLPFKFLNRFTWNLIFYGLWFNEKKRINPWRVNQLKLSPIQSSMGTASVLFENPKFPTILAINRSVIPGEKRPDDWPEQFKIPGFFFVPDTPDDEVDPRIRSFIDNEPENPPVYLGFGSMPAPDPLVLVKIAIGLVEQLNVRAVLCAGWSDLSDGINPSPNNLVTPEDAVPSEAKITLPPNLLLIKSVSHTYLFPKCSVIVHHCGIGTTAATLRAGTPSVCCPVMLDQPGNADALMKIGVAPAPIPFHTLHLEILVAAVRFTLKKPTFREKAQFWASDIAKENGVAAGADIVLNLPKQWPGQQ